MSLADRIAVMDRGVIVQCDTPLEVYRNPVNTFVAGFIGNPPMNFVPAQAVQDGVFEALGMRLAGPRGHDRLTLGLRPEDLQPASEGLRCPADVVEALGPHTLVTSLADRQVFRAALPSGLAVLPGAVLHLQPDASRLRWFDAEGRRIDVAGTTTTGA
jgi:multiple sugar transport system ATP-binding protein